VDDELIVEGEIMPYSPIHVSLLLEAEGGYDEVLALKFRYDTKLVALLKDAFREAGKGSKARVGSWSPKERCWSVSGRFWPEVRRLLLDAGCELHGPEAELPEPEPKPEPEPEGFGFLG
jgi:hypothetical protein